MRGDEMSTEEEIPPALQIDQPINSDRHAWFDGLSPRSLDVPET